MEEDGDVEEGASWLRSPACLLRVRKQLWPTEDYITYRDTYATACTHARRSVWMRMDTQRCARPIFCFSCCRVSFPSSVSSLLSSSRPPPPPEPLRP